MSDQQMQKGYQPGEVEAKWYRFWEENGMFAAGEREGRPGYSIVIPPPNVTGVLHMGHALNNTMQDILCRYRRLQGDNVLWMPGTDHAGIATQNVVEKKLHAEGTSRHELGRERFIEEVWKWKEQSGNAIINQLKRLGASCDWQRERFTMDEGLSKAVRKVFVKLYEDGLIYRGDYIINWCPRCTTALADLEVEHEELEGHLFHILYPFENGGQEGIVVATTRPETMLGDTALAVNPEDERYRDLAHESVFLPLMEREIPIIRDSYVDSSFGTGGLKVTPAHDPNDFEIGMRHDLPRVKVIGDDGRMTAEAGRFQGLTREECRKAVLEALEEQGLLKKTEPINGMVWGIATAATPLSNPTCPSSGSSKPVPWPKKPSQRCATEKPASSRLSGKAPTTTGSKISATGASPARSGGVIASRPGPAGNAAKPWWPWKSRKACTACGGTDLERETDVLDTWFSSALWPFSTMGWPDQTALLDRYYPTSVLVTGFDILFFWVARMMMMGIHFMGEIPFRDVYVHALVRDEDGQKMSKSKGNVIDPLTVIEEYGTDAFRFTLAAFAAQGRDIKMSEKRVEGYRHFINKLWNAARFALMHLDRKHGSPSTLGKWYWPTGGSSPPSTRQPPRWPRRWTNIVSMKPQGPCTASSGTNSATGTWRSSSRPCTAMPANPAENAPLPYCGACSPTPFCCCIPSSPSSRKRSGSLMPGTEGSIMQARFPSRGEHRDRDAEERMAVITAVITAIRNIRGEMGIPPSKELAVTVQSSDTANPHRPRRSTG
jgi:valyl-tRNA synthetase